MNKKAQIGIFILLTIISFMADPFFAMMFVVLWVIWYYNHRTELE